MSKKYPRDMVGYGKKSGPIFKRWPNNSKLALQIVVNYEEGGENCVLHGDKHSETFLSEIIGAQPIKGRNMNILKKLAYSILASVFVFANANAGELSVTGAAKATYTILSVDGSATDDSAGKGLGMANEFSLTAGGELDNGFTWATNIDIDAATVQDDASMVIGMGGLGSVKFNISDGGIQKNFSSSQSVYGTPVDNGEGGTYTDSPDTGAMHSIRYTTPSGLPLGLSASVQLSLIHI